MGSPVEIVKRSSAQATDLPDVHSSAFADLFDRCGDTRLVLLGEASQRCQVVGVTRLTGLYRQVPAQLQEEQRKTRQHAPPRL